MGLLSESQITELNFARVGQNVRISDKASFYNCAEIELGDNVRIDDFCVLSAGVGGICIGSYVHIAVYTSIIGAGRVHISDYCNLSSRVAIYSSNDDYSGAFMTNPMVPTHLTGVNSAQVTLDKHVIIGSGSVVLPGTHCEVGVAIGALSVVKSSCKAFGVYAGNPAVKIKDRKRNLLELEKQLMGTHAKP